MGKKSTLPTECGEKNFQQYQQNAVEKYSPLKLQVLKIFTVKFNSYLKLTGNISEESENWRIGIRSCCYVGGERFEPVYGVFFFVKESGE